MSWHEYKASVREAGSYKKRIRSYISDRNKMLDRGGQKNTPPYTKKMGTHVTFDKQLEEVEEASFNIHDELHEEVWAAEVLNGEVRERLTQIAENFIEGLEIPVEIKDLRFTGSLANYNWSRYSDIDVHILVDFAKIDDHVELVKAFFDEARMRWNDKHRIMVRGFEVEIYVEDVNEEHKSSGLYSLVEDEWIIKPEPSTIRIDFETAEKKAQDFVDRTQSVANLIDKEEYEAALQRIERIKEKIRDMRKAGLETEDAEFSAENIAFKILRRDEVLQHLNDLKLEAYDTLMSLKEE